MNRFDDSPSFPLLYPGFVKDNADPDGLGRVRVIVPGVCDPEPSDWAWPLGTVGGGAQKDGAYATPPVGADVGVLFKLGDIDHPYFLAGNWGKGEEPTAWSGVDPKDRPLVRTIEFGPFQVTWDCRDGGEKWTVTEAGGAAFIRLTNGKLELGGAATEHAVLGDVLKAKLESLMQHLESALDQVVLITVPSPFGPLGPPLNAAAITAIKALVVALRATLAQILATVTFVK